MKQASEKRHNLCKLQEAFSEIFKFACFSGQRIENHRK